MFSGQGSQYYQMGRELYSGNEAFRSTLLHLDRLLVELTGRSVVQVLYDDGHSKGEPFEQTVLTHPAIFMIEVALAETLMEMGVRPGATLGASLGTYAAAVTARSISAEAALRAVSAQAEIFSRTCPPGAMVAILAAPTLFDELAAQVPCALAAVSYSAHFVVATGQAYVGTVESWLGQRGIAFARLPVAIAFHSQWIDAARSAVVERLNEIQFRASEIPIFCCAATEPVHELTAEDLWSIARQPIDFRRTIEKMENAEPSDFIDLGPSGTLATFLKYSLAPASTSRFQHVLSPLGRDLDRLAEVLGSAAP
jgi:acyl transferase domain-containing protein